MDRVVGFISFAAFICAIAVSMALPVSIGSPALAAEPEPGQEVEWGYFCAAWQAGVEPKETPHATYRDEPIARCGGKRDVLGCFNPRRRVTTLRRFHSWERLLRTATHEGHHAVQHDQGWALSEREADAVAEKWRDCLMYM